MPNWCQNRWQLSGAPDKVKAAVDALVDTKGDSRTITFSRLFPRPAFLDRTVSPNRRAVLGAGTACAVCNGTGRTAPVARRCPRCNGSGVLSDGVCPTCDGLGTVSLPERCPACEGLGFLGRTAEHWVFENLGPWAILIARGMTPEETAVCEEVGAWNWYDWSCAHWGVECDAVDGDVAYDDGDEFATLCFDTPWGPPNAFHAAFVAAHPDVSVSAFYDEPGMELAGYL